MELTADLFAPLDGYAAGKARGRSSVTRARTSTGGCVTPWTGRYGLELISTTVLDARIVMLE